LRLPAASLVPATTVAGGLLSFGYDYQGNYRRAAYFVDRILRGTPAGEPFIVPLAIPFIAGPSALATVMLMATREPGKLGMWAAAITVTMVLVAVILLMGERLQRLMGDRLMQAIERLMGLILTAMAVEMLLGGIRAFVAGLR